ncbi:MAG TPA: hypothetical protein VGN51_00220 [Acidimicrobiia bacterium]
MAGTRPNPERRDTTIAATKFTTTVVAIALAIAIGPATEVSAMTRPAMNAPMASDTCTSSALTAVSQCVAGRLCAGQLS